MLTILCILAVAGLLATLGALIWGKIPWYVPVLLMRNVLLLLALVLRVVGQVV